MSVQTLSRESLRKTLAVYLTDSVYGRLQAAYDALSIEYDDSGSVVVRAIAGSETLTLSFPAEFMDRSLDTIMDRCKETLDDFIFRVWGASETVAHAGLRIAETVNHP